MAIRLASITKTTTLADNTRQMRVALIVMILILLAQPRFRCLNKHRCQGCSGPVSGKHKSKLIMDCRFQLPHNNIAATIRFCREWISNRNADSVFDKFIHRNSRCFKLRFIINSPPPQKAGQSASGQSCLAASQPRPHRQDPTGLSFAALANLCCLCRTQTPGKRPM